MNEKQLEKGKELVELINKTKDAIAGLKRLYKKGEEDGDHFWLSIAEHSDGSGKKGDLCRYRGNGELLTIIIETLKNQLRDFEFEFKKL